MAVNWIQVEEFEEAETEDFLIGKQNEAGRRLALRYASNHNSAAKAASPPSKTHTALQ